MSTYADLIERLRSDYHLTQGDGYDALIKTGAAAADAISRLEREKAEAVALANDLASQFMQAFDCYGIPYSDAQREVEARYLAFRTQEPPHAHKDA